MDVIGEVANPGEMIGVVLQQNAATENPTPADLHEVGTAAAIVRYLTTPDGTHHLVCQGQQRFRIVKFLDGYPFPVARVELAHETDTLTPEIEARMIQVKERAVEALELIPQAPAELAVAVQEIKLPGVLADFIAGLMDIQPEEKQAVLETADSQRRLDMILSHLLSRIEVLRLSREISGKLAFARPATLGAAARISGVTPAALVALLKHVKRRGQDAVNHPARWAGPHA